MTLRVLVLGSCVTRDVFAIHADSTDVQLSGYIARTSLGSAFAQRSGAKYDKAREASAFRRRMVEIDMSKQAAGLIGSDSWDVLVLDFVDERFDLVVDAGGGIATVSSEFRTGYVPSREDTFVSSGTTMHFELWRRGLEELASLLARTGKEGQVRINAPAWASGLEDGSVFQNSSAEYILRGNAYQMRLVEEAQRVLNCDVWTYDPNRTRGAVEHKWGQSPFHFETAYYDALWGNLSTTRVAPDKSPGYR